MAIQILQGQQGPPGPPGPPGQRGSRGADGKQGPIGPPGQNGSPGPAGRSGNVGPVGATGQTGPRGYAGSAGPTGATGADGATGPAGPPGAAGASISDRGEVYSIGSSEAWIAEYLVDFGELSSTATATLAGFTKQDLTLGGTYIVRIGGTSGVADGMVVVTLSTSQSSYPNIPDTSTGSPFSNPGGWQLVKLSAAGLSSSARAHIKQISIGIA